VVETTVAMNFALLDGVQVAEVDKFFELAAGRNV
jgi:hypothetical protein